MNNQRLFWAIPLSAWLKAAIETQLAEWRATIPLSQQEHIRFIPAANWHVTVYFFGDVPANTVELIRRQLARIAQTAPPFELFPQSLILAPPEKTVKNMVWLHLQKHPLLTSLSWQIYEAVRTDLAASGTAIAAPRPILVPHVTVARLKNIASALLPPLPAFAMDKPIAVSQSELWDSVVGTEGAQYSAVAAFPFG